jgi:hypothetical protein
LKYRPINIIEVVKKRKATCQEILLVKRGEKNPENPLILKILIQTIGEHDVSNGNLGIILSNL